MGAMILSFTSIKYLANGVGPYKGGILETQGAVPNGMPGHKKTRYS